MKRILTILAILSLIGGAAGLPNFGPAQGFSNRGDISLGGDLTVGDDADVVADLTAGTITSDGAVTATTTVTGEQLTSTDDATIADTLTADNLVSVNDTTVGGALDVDGATTLDGLTVAEAATFSSTVALNDDATLAAGKDLICASGASEINFAAGTGIFTSPSGTNTLQGDVVISEGKDLGMSGASTFTTGTGAVSLNGDTTVATAKTLAVTDADALTVGGVIVPQEEVIVWQIDASSVDENIFIASDAWNITHIEEVHAVAGTHGDPVTLMVRVCGGTEAPANGDATQSAAFDLKGTANTVQAATLTETITLADGDRIALDYTGDLTALAGGVVTIHMVRV